MEKMKRMLADQKAARDLGAHPAEPPDDSQRGNSGGGPDGTSGGGVPYEITGGKETAQEKQEKRERERQEARAKQQEQAAARDASEREQKRAKGRALVVGALKRQGAGLDEEDAADFLLSELGGRLEEEAERNGQDVDTFARAIWREVNHKGAVAMHTAGRRHESFGGDMKSTMI